MTHDACDSNGEPNRDFDVVLLSFKIIMMVMITWMNSYMTILTPPITQTSWFARKVRNTLHIILPSAISSERVEHILTE